MTTLRVELCPKGQGKSRTTGSVALGYGALAGLACAATLAASLTTEGKDVAAPLHLEFIWHRGLETSPRSCRIIAGRKPGTCGNGRREMRELSTNPERACL